MKKLLLLLSLLLITNITYSQKRLQKKFEEANLMFDLNYGDSFKEYTIEKLLFFEGKKIVNEKPCNCILQESKNELRIIFYNELEIFILHKSKNNSIKENKNYTKYESLLKIKNPRSENKKIEFREVNLLILKRINGLIISDKKSNKGIGILLKNKKQ